MTTTNSYALRSHAAIKRHQSNPILTRKDVPYKSALAYNAGVTKYQGRYVMVFRNDYGDFDNETIEGVHLGLAYSEDGIKWKVEPKPCLDLRDNEILRIYDPRLTVIKDRCYMCFAVDTRHGLRGGIAGTEDFESFDVLSMSVPDNRNMVLFPEKVDGLYVRLERPLPVYSRDNVERFDIWMSDSPDLKYWGNSRLLLGVEDIPYANNKIGPGAPPVRTDKGWIVVFHAVDVDESRGKNGWETFWKKRYTAGVMLLDLDDPCKVIGLCKDPLLVPEETYEISGGIRNNVIFPGGIILEDDGQVKIYYGAADTVECVATAHVDDLLNLCKSF